MKSCDMAASLEKFNCQLEDMESKQMGSPQNAHTPSDKCRAALSRLKSAGVANKNEAPPLPSAWPLMYAFNLELVV
jgi:hypothetical protein